MGRGPGRGQGQGLKKQTPRPGPLTGVGRGIEAGARRFRGPGGPVTNTSPVEIVGGWLIKTREFQQLAYPSGKGTGDNITRIHGDLGVGKGLTK